MPYDEDNPNIAVEYFKNALWNPITADVINFTVKDGGVFTGSSASIKLNNKNGKYTSGASKIPVYSKVRILGNVRDVTDTIFEGRFQRSLFDFKNVKENILTLGCTGHEKILEWYTMTFDFTDFPVLTYKDVIETCLSHPDGKEETGEGTGITLETDSGAILDTHKIGDIKQESLSSIIREICERINYSGYMQNETNLTLKAVGTEPSNPLVTLESPFVYVRSLFDIEQLKNYAMPYDTAESCIPTDDRLTEKTITLYPDSWNPTDATQCSVEDSQTEKCEKQWSIKINRIKEGRFQIDAKLDLSKIYEIGYIDLTEKLLSEGQPYRFIRMSVSVKPEYNICIFYELVDTEDNRICNRPNSGLYLAFQHIYTYEKFSEIFSGINPTEPIRDTQWDAQCYGGWWYVTKNTTFNWKIKEFRVFTIPTLSGNWLYVDALKFLGGKPINSRIYTDLIKKDQDSIDDYGHRTLPLSDSTLNSFDNAKALAEYNLNVMKTPIQKVEVKKGAKIWVKPSQTVTLTVPEAEIAGTWRTVEIQTEWRNKILRTTFKVVPQFEPVTRRTFGMDELTWLISRK